MNAYQAWYRGLDLGYCDEGGRHIECPGLRLGARDTAVTAAGISKVSRITAKQHYQKVLAGARTPCEGTTIVQAVSDCRGLPMAAYTHDAQQPISWQTKANGSQ